MKHLLVCTIMRNARGHLERYNAQLAGLRAQLKGYYTVHVSIYENDSTDGTAEWLQQARDAGRLHAHCFPDQPTQSTITTAKLGTQQYGSVWDIARLRQLAAARQACLDQARDQLLVADKVAFIEPDVSWDASWCAELVLAAHPKAAGLPEPDIYSGWSLRSASHPKEAQFLYDTCATRATRDDLCWDISEACGTWRGQSLVPTGLGGVHANCLHRLWSTFNCFCVYRAAPFAAGLRWGYINTRFNPSGIYVDDGDHGSGWVDCDTAVMCERFRAAGYGGIYLNTNCLIRHL